MVLVGFDRRRRLSPVGLVACRPCVRFGKREMEKGVQSNLPPSRCFACCLVVVWDSPRWVFFFFSGFSSRRGMCVCNLPTESLNGCSSSGVFAGPRAAFFRYLSGVRDGFGRPRCSFLFCVFGQTCMQPPRGRGASHPIGLARRLFGSASFLSFSSTLKAVHYPLKFWVFVR